MRVRVRRGGSRVTKKPRAKRAPSARKRAASPRHRASPHVKKAKAIRVRKSRVAKPRIRKTRVARAKKTRVARAKKARVSVTHKKSTGTRKTSGGGAVTGGAVLSALGNDPAALSALTQEVAGALLSGGFAAEIISAIERVIQGQKGGPTLIAGTISTLAGALQLNTGGQAYTAMVFLNGAATASPCYVPTHLRATIATGQDVWVMPINGGYNDLQIFSIRNVF